MGLGWARVTWVTVGVAVRCNEGYTFRDTLLGLRGGGHLVGKGVDCIPTLLGTSEK